MNQKTIENLIEKEKSDKKNIVIEIYGGCFSAIHNVPRGHTYSLIDWDNLKKEE